MRIPSKNGDLEQVVVERGKVGGALPSPKVVPWRLFNL